MAEGKDGGGSSASSSDAKPEAKRTYTVVGAVGPKDSNPDELDFKVLGRTEASTQAAAKAAILEANPDFPGLQKTQAGGPGGDAAARQTDLQSLVRGEQLWLLADSGWSPKLVQVEQPKPKFTGL